MHTATLDDLKRIAGAFAIGLALIAGTTGCRCDQAAVPLESRLIDVHTHTFNAHYLPLREIALGKRDKLSVDEPPPDWVAKAVARFILLNTPWPGRIESFDRNAETALESAARSVGRPKEALVAQPMIDALVRLETALAQESLSDEPWTDEALAGAFSERQRVGLDQLAKLFGTAPGFIRAYRSLTARDDRQVERYMRQSSDKGNRDKFALLVSQMMDLAPVYDQRPRDGTLLNFRDQIRRMDALQKRYADEPEGPTLIYFVAYNPFRDHWNGGTDGAALSIVQDAIEKHGAYGVKIYPPSGYRPNANGIPDKPVSPREAPLRQWTARYGPLRGDATLLDKRLNRLLEYCEKEGIPILVHSNTGEFEARNGYGRKMAHPKYWEQWLKNRSQALGRPSPLRLCFGHAGGRAYWFGKEPFPGDASWGMLVARLCTQYPNVYCEIGVHDQIVEPEKRRNFENNLARLFADSKDSAYPFSSKVMYGTDYFMPLGIDLSDYLCGYHTAFQHEDLKPYYERFFFRNAVDFLDVKTRSSDRRLPSAIRTRLSQLVTVEQR